MKAKDMVENFWGEVNGRIFEDKVLEDALLHAVQALCSETKDLQITRKIMRPESCPSLLLEQHDKWVAFCRLIDMKEAEGVYKKAINALMPDVPKAMALLKRKW